MELASSTSSAVMLSDRGRQRPVREGEPQGDGQCDWLVEHCRLFMASVAQQPQFELLNAIADVIDERTETDCLNDIVDVGLLDCVRDGLATHDIPRLSALSKFLRKWSLVDGRIGHRMFNEGVLNLICDIVMGVCQDGSDSAAMVCENFILAVHNVLIDVDCLGKDELERIIRFSIAGYYAFESLPPALHANILLTGVIANKYLERVDPMSTTDMLNALLAVIAHESAGQMVGPLGSAAMGSLFHVIVDSEHQKGVVTPQFLQVWLPRYLGSAGLIDPGSGYAVFCRLATSPQAEVRSSTLNLAPLHVIAEMFRKGSDQDKITFCDTIACVIEKNPEHMFQFYEQEIIETIALFAASESFGVKQAAMRCVCRVFEIAEADHAAQWRLMKAVLPNLEDFLDDNHDEFSPLVFDVLLHIDSLPEREKAYYFSRIASLIDSLIPANEDEEALLWKFREMQDRIAGPIESETKV